MSYLSTKDEQPRLSCSQPWWKITILFREMVISTRRKRISSSAVPPRWVVSLFIFHFLIILKAKKAELSQFEWQKATKRGSKRLIGSVPIWLGGRTPGIYRSVTECRAQTSGYPGAKCKAFSTQDDASAWLTSTSPNTTSPAIIATTVKKNQAKAVRYYAIAISWTPGIYTDSALALASHLGYRGAKYKRFNMCAKAEVSCIHITATILTHLLMRIDGREKMWKAVSGYTVRKTTLPISRLCLRAHSCLTSIKRYKAKSANLTFRPPQLVASSVRIRQLLWHNPHRPCNLSTICHCPRSIEKKPSAYKYIKTCASWYNSQRMLPRRLTLLPYGWYSLTWYVVV